MAPPHHISPSLDEQLVLELEAWIAVDEVVEVFPGGRCCRLVLPMHQHLPHTSGQASAGGALWNRLRCAVVGGGQRWRRGWWNPHKLLEQPDMEDIMQPDVRSKLKAVGDVVDDGGDAVWPVETGS